jgi:hypothetical protein
MLTILCIICKKPVEPAMVEAGKGVCSKCELAVFHGVAPIWKQRQKAIKGAKTCNDFRF